MASHLRSGIVCSVTSREWTVPSGSSRGPSGSLLAAVDFEKAAGFIASEWSTSHILTKDSDLFSWLYLENPEWQSRDYFSVAVTTRDDRITGLLAFIPFRLSVRGVEEPSAWMSLWVSEPGNGSGAGVLPFLNLKRAYRFLGSIGMSDFSLRTYRALGGKETEALPRVVFGFRATEERLLESIESLHGPTFPGPAVFAAFSWLDDPERTAGFTRWSLSGSNEEWDASVWGPIRAQHVGPTRNFQFIKWRYLQHPHYRYQVVSAESGEEVGFIVWRVQAVSLGPQESDQQGVKVIRVVDFCVTGPAVAKKLIDVLASEAAAGRALFADFYCSDLKSVSYAAAAGGNTAEPPWSAFFPSHLSPVVPRGLPLAAAVIDQTGHNLAEAFVAGEFYMTSADSDQDRPNV
jgi:hypothetical protein